MKLPTAILMAMLLVTACARSKSPELREKIAKEFTAGTLTPDRKGVVYLSGDLADASLNAEAFVTANPAGKPWLLLRYWRGKGANFRGYLYAPGAALKVGKLANVTTKSINDVASVDAEVTVDLGGDWYEVYFGMD